MISLRLPLLLVLVSAVSTATADEKLFGIACRSVHLGYPAPEAKAFYNSITPRQSADGTYFMVCGWNKGYFGMQELADGNKVVLFSVWDPGDQNDPKIVPEERQVQVLKQADDVRVKRFGGEGTGGQCFFDFDWKLDETYHFIVTCQPDGVRTAYSGYLYVGGEQGWKHLVTFSTITGGQSLKGLYSFVEDFRRNKVSTTKTRTAEFGVGWVRTSENDWAPLRSAWFTGDSNPATNIDGGLMGQRFFLSTGGEITAEHGTLRQLYTLPEEIHLTIPAQLSEFNEHLN